MSEPTNAQRALWTFLAYTLAGPFIAALAVVALRVLLPPLNLGALLPAATPGAGQLGVAAFVWSAIPAGVAALAVVPLVLRSGTVSAVTAAAAGVMGFAIATVVAPVPIGDLRPSLAVLAGLVSLAVRAALTSVGILKR